MDVPQLNLRRQTEIVEADIVRLVSETCASGMFAGGPHVAGFEKEYAEYLGAGEVVGVSTGTAALHLVFRALGLSSDDEVVLPANSFIATAEAVALAGARPVLCDVEPDTALASARTFERAITSRTRVLVPVHLFGNVVEMDPVLELARRHRLHVVEDAAQAHGAAYRTGACVRRAGAIGDAGCFSFYPTKNLGSIGEGGAVAARDPELAARVRQLRDHGQRQKHVHELIGDNCRLHAIQAGTLRIKLPYLDAWNARRREVAARYHEAADRLGIPCVQPPPGSESVYHQFVIRVKERARWMDHLRRLGVGTAVHYPTPIHLQPPFRGNGAGPVSLPACEALAREILSLPMFVGITDAEVDHVIGALGEVARWPAGDPTFVPVSSITR